MRKATLFTAPFTGAYTFSIMAQCNNSTSSKLGVGYSATYDGGRKDILAEITLGTYSTQTAYTFTVNLNAGDTIYMYPYLVGSYPNITIGSDNSAYTVTFNLTKNSNVPGTAKELKSIGALGVISIYGIDNNKVYKGGLMIDKTTTATTGSITLGNAVGYITVNLNGEIVKIPYYNE